MSVQVPELPDECWPVVVPDDKADAWAALTAEQRAYAEARAASLLRVLTGYRVGGCATTVRPCRAGCAESTWATYASPGAGGVGGGVGWRPVLHSGVWLNIGCGHAGACGCVGLSVLELPGVVGGVTEVVVDGVTLDPTAYRLDGRLLYRLDGEPWPLVQDLSLPLSEPGTFGVTFTPGVPVDGLGARAAGLLAVEYANLATTGSCRLPANVTQVTRQGVALELDPEAGGLTGIEEVDAYVRRWNPQRLVSRSRVWSPDTARVRNAGTGVTTPAVQPVVLDGGGA